MTDIKKYVEGKTQEELIKTQRNSVVGGDVYQAVTFEIQRIQQDTNNIQIAKLIVEVQKLKDITNQNIKTEVKDSKRTRNLAWLAILIAVIGILVQVALSINRKDSCADFGGGDIRCTTWFEAGVFGTYIIPERSITK